MTKVGLIAAALALPACATLHPARPADGVVRVNPASIAAEPAGWDGRQVEIVGLLIWEFENSGLYQSYGSYCRAGEKTAIHVEWERWPGVSPADNRRRVMVRGVFRNRPGVTQPDGSILASTGAPGPGPLEPGSLTRWLSNPLKPCPVTR